MNADVRGRNGLVLASVRTLAWAPLLASVSLALACAAFLVVLPHAAQETLALMAAVVLGCGTAAAVDDPPAELTAVQPVPERARLGLRAVAATAVTGTGLLLELAVLLVAGARTDRGDLVVAYVCTGLVGLAAAALAHRWRLGLSGVTAAVTVVGGGLVLRSVLPGQVAQTLPEISTTTGVLLCVGAGGLVLAWATRDPAARP